MQARAQTYEVMSPITSAAAMDADMFVDKAIATAGRRSYDRFNIGEQRGRGPG